MYSMKNGLIHAVPARWCYHWVHRYDLHKEFEGANASQLLHDVHGDLVTVNQDGGAGAQPVWDWGQAETRYS